MIYNALKVVETKLNAHLNTLPGMTDEASPDLAMLGNVAMIDGQEDAESLDNKIIISLINVDEEGILKNGPFHTVQNGNVKKHNPTIFVNLYVLFTANFGSVESETLGTGYDDSLKFLSEVITFFQGQFVFDHQNTPDLDSNIEKLILDIHTLNFEYMNHLWGILGGKYLPSIMYKIRLIPMKARIEEPAAVVEALGGERNSL